MAVELYYTPLYNDASLKAYYRFEGNSNDAKGTNNGTDANMTYGAGTGKFGQGAIFNGTSSTITIPSATAINVSVFTYTFWLYADATPNNCGIFCSTSADSPSIKTSSNLLSLTKLNTADIKYAATTVSTSAWTHWAITYDASGNAKWYYNGELNSSGTSLQTFTFSDRVMGKYLPEEGEFYDGKIDDFALFSRVLSADEIRNLYLGTWGNFLAFM